MEEKHLICNCCGHEMDFWDQQEDFSIIKPALGYGTIYDGDKLELRICCSCLEKLIDQCKISPITDVSITRGGRT